MVSARCAKVGAMSDAPGDPDKGDPETSGGETLSNKAAKK